MLQNFHTTEAKTVKQAVKKAAKFTSPTKKRLFRKRKATPENWKKNIRKRRRLSGDTYISSSGKTVQRKSVQECDCSKCRYKCNQNISFEQRTVIRNFYYGLDSYERQKDYICSRVQEKNTKTCLKATTKRTKAERTGAAQQAARKGAKDRKAIQQVQS